VLLLKLGEVPFRFRGRLFEHAAETGHAKRILDDDLAFFEILRDAIPVGKVRERLAAAST
jgi:hypothetical protein